jgi:hypothetical protein
MNRADIARDYIVRNGRISSPGKFEGEMVYVPYYWDIGMNGFADIDDGRVCKFQVTTEDKKEFPELKRRRWVSLYEDDNGFVREE